MHSRGFLLLILLGSVLLRGSTLVSNHLHVDEPRWMVRGLFLIDNLQSGDLAALQTEHWTGRITPEMSQLSASLASGSVTAMLTGAGVQLGDRLLPTLSSQDEPFKRIFCARIFHALLSSLTPLLLFLFLRRRVSEAGAACAAGFLMFEPLIHYWGGMAHLEAVLTLAAPLSLLLYERARRRGSIRLVVAAGVFFGLAFANRANAAAIPLALLVYTGIRVWTEPGGAQPIWPRIRKEGVLLLLFGLTGWLVFVLLYPPIWGNPVGGVSGLHQGLCDFLRPDRSEQAHAGQLAEVPFPAGLDVLDLESAGSPGSERSQAPSVSDGSRLLPGVLHDLDASGHLSLPVSLFRLAGSGIHRFGYLCLAVGEVFSKIEAGLDLHGAGSGRRGDDVSPVQSGGRSGQLSIHPAKVRRTA